MTTATRSPQITHALEELKRAFSDSVTMEADDGSGVIVRIAHVALSSRWSSTTGDLWFLIPFHYPDAAIYPYYVTTATPSAGYIGALQPVQWRGMSAIQVSLRHTGWNPSVDTALGSVRQTLAWLQTN